MGRGPRPQEPPPGSSNEAWDAWQERMDAWNNGGQRFSAGERSHITVKPTNDPKVPGGHFVSIGDDDDHSTAVYNPDGTLADVKANREWRDTPRQ